MSLLLLLHEFSTGPEEKGIETESLGYSFQDISCSALALKKKG